MKKQVRNKTLRCAVLEKSSTTLQSGGTQSYRFTLTPIISLEPHQAPKLCQTFMQVWSLVVRVASTPSQWELLKSRQHTRSIAAPFFWAYEPHSMKTRPSRLVLSHCTTASVNVSHPLSLCELAWCARTVNTAFSSRTPAKSRTGSSCCGRSETLACKNILNMGKFEQILKDYEACIRMHIHICIYTHKTILTINCFHVLPRCKYHSKKIYNKKTLMMQINSKMKNSK